MVRSVPENKAGLWLSKLSTPGDSEEMQHAQVLTARPSPGGDAGAQPGPVRVCCGSAARELLVSPRDRERSMWAWLRVMRRGHGMQGVEGCKRCSELQRMQGVQQAARGARDAAGCRRVQGVRVTCEALSRGLTAAPGGQPCCAPTAATLAGHSFRPRSLPLRTFSGSPGAPGGPSPGPTEATAAPRPQTRRPLSPAPRPAAPHPAQLCGASVASPPQQPRPIMWLLMKSRPWQSDDIAQ